MLPHINYLLSLHQWDLDSPALIAEIMKPYRMTSFGAKFFRFILDRITQRNLFNAPLFNLLAIYADTKTTDTNIQMFIINKMIKQQKLREIMMETNQSHKKIELIEIFQKKRRTLKDNVILQEKDFLDAHIAIINLYSKCSHMCASAILQVRKMVEVDSIYNNLFSEAIPYVFKRMYFRFFFEVYIRMLPDIRFIDVNNEKFVSLMTYVVLEDLKIYGQYLPGLLIRSLEDEGGNIFDDAARDKKILRQELEEQSLELTNQFDRDKQQREIDKFKDYKMKLSPLTSTKSIPLFTEEKIEYWTYLTSKYGVEDENDGLFHFLIDIFDNIEKNSTFKMEKPFREISTRIRKVLATMSDTLHSLYELNKNEFYNLPEIIHWLDLTIQKIPTQKEMKKTKKKRLGTHPDLEQEGEDSDTVQSDEEEKGNTGEMNSGVQKVLQLVRDHIIKSDLSVREAFELPEINTDHFLEFHEFKAMLKKICGVKASYDQIENCTEFIFNGTLKLEEDKKKQDLLTKVLDKGYIEKQHEEVINFKYFEQIIRKILKKAGYKPALKKRERDEEQRIDFVMEKDRLGVNITNDFRNFVKLFMQFNDSMDESTEKELIFLPHFSSILKNLKDNISKGAIGNETDDALLAYFKNLLKFIGRTGSYLYLIKIFIFILNCFNPKHYLHKKMYFVGHDQERDEIEFDENDKNLYRKIQNSMNDAGVTHYVIDLIATHDAPKMKGEAMTDTDAPNSSMNLEEYSSKDQLKYACLNEAINLLNCLLDHSNAKIQDTVLRCLKTKNKNVGFFHYIQDRLLTGYLKTRQISVDNELMYKSDEGSLMSAKNYLKNSLKTKENYNCLNVLTFIQLFCSTKNADKQQGALISDYLHEQVNDDESDKHISINLVSEIVDLLDRLTRLKVDVFRDFITSRIAKSVLKTLIKLVSGPSFKNQEYLGSWRKLHRILNFFVCQELDDLVPITEERGARIASFCLSVELIKAILKTKKENKHKIAKSIIDEISVRELVNKLVQIESIYHTKKTKSLLSFFQNKYEKKKDPEESVMEAAHSLFVVLIDLKLEHPFTTDLLNFNLNIEPFWNLYELAKPIYQEKLEDTSKGKTEADVETAIMPKHTSKDAKIFDDKLKFERGIFEEHDDKKTNRTDAEDIDSEVSLIQDHEEKKKRKCRVCCLPINKSDGCCKKMCKFFWFFSCLNLCFRRSSNFKIANKATAKKKQKLTKQEKKAQVMNKLAQFSIQDYNLFKSMLYFLSNTAVVNIVTNAEIMTIYFPIPKYCLQGGKPMIVRAVNDLKYRSKHDIMEEICYKALLVHERAGGTKKKRKEKETTNKLSEITKILVNNLPLLRNIMFWLLVAYFGFEVADNINDYSFTDVALGFSGASMFVIELLIFVCFMIDTWYTTKLSLRTKFKVNQKRKTNEGSLGYNAFPREINNTEIVQDDNVVVDKKKILKTVLLNKDNLVNFVMLLITFISLVAYNQIFRVLLLLKLNKLDIKRYTLSNLYLKYTGFFKLVAVF